MPQSTFSAYKIRMPFRFSYGHAKAKHNYVESVIGLLEGDNGLIGLGEAVPRSYVTGESADSVFSDVLHLARNVIHNTRSPEQAIETLLQLAEKWEGDFPSCAFCVIDMCLMDLLAKQRKIPLYNLLSDSTQRPLYYTGSIGMGSGLTLMPKLLAYRTAGLKSFKLKVGVGDDVARLKYVRRILGKDVRIYADANGAWEKEEALVHIEALQAHGIWAIEEPVREKDALDEQHYRDYTWLRDRCTIPIIADESFISLKSLETILEYRSFDILNVRLSKCGGFRFSQRMIRRIIESNLSFAIGAMVGESGILATAGSHLGTAFPDYQMIQGHSHPFLHKNSLVKGTPHMERGGVLNVSSKYGLGVEINSEVLQRITEKRCV